MANDGLSAGAAARRLGVAVTTLRTWHQRYGLGPSRHEPGHHRRYTVEDMVRLQVMQRLTAQGVSPAEAAAWARRAPSDASLSGGSPDASGGSPELTAADLAGFPSAAPHPGASGRSGVSSDVAGGSADPVDSVPAARVGDGEGGAPADLAGGAPADLAGATPAGLVGSAPAGGGQTIPLGPRANPAARGLARAAMRLDGPSMRYIIEAAVTGRGVILAWIHVIMPVLIGIGERYEATARFIEVEHLLSRTVTEVLAAVPRPPRDREPRTLLAAADEEQHTLPLEALAAALAEQGVPTRLLGARVPSQALLDAVNRTGPVVVVLWSQLPGSGSIDQLERIQAVPHPPLILAAAGPGWPVEGLPPTVTTLGDLASAVRLIARATSD
ncbi:MerR family transcriptional regulator [Actinoplanes missouriensis]|uniref:MerR family transcriptional regulator n=1 Tax=Actinoplanes missouriensis TaxID=1866 RepID=UPI0033E05315